MAEQLMAPRAQAKPVDETQVALTVEQADHVDEADQQADPNVAATEADKVGARRDDIEHRFEEFERVSPDGKVVRIRRNIDTGEQTAEVDDAEPEGEADADPSEDGE
jgi:hypothetical protein